MKPPSRNERSTLACAARLCLCAVALLSGARAWADRDLTLEDALALARRGNRDLAATQETLAQVQVVVDQVRAQMIPTLAAQGKYTFNSPVASLDPKLFSAPVLGLADALKGTATAAQAQAIQGFESNITTQTGKPIVITTEHQLDLSVTATVPLVVPSAYPAYQAAVARRAATVANTDVTETSVLFGVASAFYSAAGADEIVAARKYAIEVATKTVNNARTRFAEGVVTRIEVTRADLALIKAVQQLDEAEDARENGYRVLATLIQLREPFVVRPEGNDPAEQDVGDLQQRARSLRPEFRAYDLDMLTQRKQGLSSLLQWAPTLSAFGNVRAFNYTGFSGQIYGIAAGVQADWLIYDGGLRDASRRQAASLRRQLALQLAQLHDTVKDDIAKAARELKTKRKALQSALKSLALAKETLELVRVQHDAGRATQLDLLEAQNTLFSADATVAQARFDLALGHLLLDRTAGIFPRRYAGSMPGAMK